MIEIRNSLFETNSSSCHVFCYKADEDVSVPAVVNLIPNSEDNLLNMWFNDYYRWHRPWKRDDDLIEFIQDLYAIGVRTIRSPDAYLQDLAEKCKDEPRLRNTSRSLLHQFKQICFGAESKVFTMSDECGIGQKDVDKAFGPGYDFTCMRLS